MGDNENQFREIAIGLFNMACDTLLESGAGYPHVQPTVVPFTADGPGKLIVCTADTEDAANAMAIGAIEEGTGKWTGYIHLRHALITSAGVQNNAILLHGWDYDRSIHVVCRYRAHSERDIEFIDETPMPVTQIPQNYLLNRKLEVTGELVRALVSETLEPVRQYAAKTDYPIAPESVWPGLLPALKFDISPQPFPEHLWQRLRTRVKRVVRLTELNAPEVILQNEVEQFEAKLIETGLAHR